MNQYEQLLRAAQSAPVEDLRDATNLLVTRQIEREAESQREKKHEEALAACVECSSRIERLKLEFAAANDAYLQADRLRQNADLRLSDYLARRPSGYASKLQIETFEAHLSELQSLVDEARAEAIGADQLRNELGRALREADEKLNGRPGGLSFREEQLRPRQAPQPHRPGFSLGAVR